MRIQNPSQRARGSYSNTPEGEEANTLQPRVDQSLLYPPPDLNEESGPWRGQSTSPNQWAHRNTHCMPGILQGLDMPGRRKVAVKGGPQ